MASNLRWFCEPRVLYAKFYGDHTLDMIYRGAESLLEVLESLHAPQPIHVIWDAREQTKGPTNLAEMKRACEPVLGHSKLGWNVVITTNPIHKFVGSVVIQVAKADWRIVNTTEEAASFLQKVDLTLPPLPTTIGENAPLLNDIR